jgi:hypothetical protein
VEIKRAADLHALPWHRLRSFLHHELGKYGTFGSGMIYNPDVDLFSDCGCRPIVQKMNRFLSEYDCKSRSTYSTVPVLIEQDITFNLMLIPSRKVFFIVNVLLCLIVY